MVQTLAMLNSAVSVTRNAIRSGEEWWFDKSRHVQTAGNVVLRNVGLTREVGDSGMYVPVRPANARVALRSLPIQDPSAYTFLDLGSGKGRMLFVAAEQPFRRVIGVEFSPVLHAQATQNIAQFRSGSRRCKAIESVHADATEYDFPDGNLVLYLFNPFGAETMSRVLANLDRSFRQSPRHIVVLMLWPIHGDMVAQMDCMRKVQITRRHQIYETNPQV